MTKTQVNSFFAGILGGFSSFVGPVVGAIILPIAEQIVQTILYAFKFSKASDWGSVIVYGLLLVVVLIKPQGLFGKKILKKV
jgi:branched-chain amino acid transport system permease protein